MEHAFYTKTTPLRKNEGRFDIQRSNRNSINFYSVDDEFTTHLLRRLHVMRAMKNEQVIQN